VIESLLAFAAEFEAKAVSSAIRENDATGDHHPQPAGGRNGAARSSPE
jgi:hypothetical protein